MRRSWANACSSATLTVIVASCGRIAFSPDEGPPSDALLPDEEPGCQQVIEASMSDLPPAWRLNGDAVMDATTMSAMLLDVTSSNAGSLVYRTPLALDRASITFEHWIGMGDGGDGLGVMLTTSGSTALGAPSSGLGFGGLEGYGVELDTHYNTSTCISDINDNHVGIDLLAPCSVGTLPTPLLQQSVSGFTLSDAQWHTTQIELDHGVISVSLDGVRYIDRFAIPGWTNEPKWVGFSAGNGGDTARYLVRNVNLTVTVPCM